MAEEQVFSVDGRIATSASRVSLTAAGFRERDHLQEWVIAHPEILGDDSLIISFEYDRWLTGAGAPTSERLDVLALDTDGRLVVAELKRDKAPDSVVVQALNYAAMVRGFSLDQLAEVFLAHRSELGTVDVAIAALQTWAPTVSDETLAPPRVVLVAEDFSSVVTNTALFLIEQGLDLRLVRVQLYRLAEGPLTLTASQLLPLPGVEEFMVRPRSTAQTQRNTRAAAARRASIVERLVASQHLADGQSLTIVVPERVGQNRDAITEWLEAKPERAAVRWLNDVQRPIEWVEDGDRYNLTDLISRIIEESTDAPPKSQVWGPNWYQVADGTVLYKVADTLPDATPGKFDWTRLHKMLSHIAPGEWTTYGDLAEVIDTAAMPLGGHVVRCSDCPAAWRILGADGRSRPEFRFADPDDKRTQLEVLASEGVRFANGAADPAQRVPISRLASWQ